MGALNLALALGAGKDMKVDEKISLAGASWRKLAQLSEIIVASLVEFPVRSAEYAGNNALRKSHATKQPERRTGSGSSNGYTGCTTAHSPI